MLFMMKNQRSSFVGFFVVLIVVVGSIAGNMKMSYALDNNGGNAMRRNHGHRDLLMKVLNDNNIDENQKRRLSEAIHLASQKVTDHIVFESTTKHNDGRVLKQDYNPTTRVCGEEIGMVTASEIQAMATIFLQAIFPNPEDATLLQLASAVLLGQVSQDIILVKVCMTCEEAKALLEKDGNIPVGNSDEKYSFNNICADGSYGVNETESAIAFIPINPLGSGSSMRGFMFGRGTTIPQDDAPSERVPADWTQYMADNINDPGTIIVEQIDVFVPAAYSAVGAVAIMPDFLGYGDSYMIDRPFLHKELYARSYVLTYLATREYIRIESSGCSDLEPTVTVGGYSEGGYSSIPGALGLQQSIGVTILGAYPGGSVFQPGVQVGYFMELVTNNDPPPDEVIGLLGTYFAYSLSNEFPFLVNTGTNQYALSNEYREGDVTSNALLWYQSPAELGFGVIAFLPLDDLLTAVNPDLTAVYAEARQLGIDDACASDLATSSTTINKLCEAIDLENMIPELEIVNFPTVICHSPDDEVVTYKNVPDLTTLGNDNVSLYAGIPDLNVLVPEGTHFEGALYCGISPILALQDSSSNSPAFITPMDMCLPDYASAPTDGTTPAPTPATTAPSPVEEDMPSMEEESPSGAPAAGGDGDDSTSSPTMSPSDQPTSDTSSRSTWMAMSTGCILSTALAYFVVA